MASAEHCPGPQSNDAGRSSACEGCPNKSACSSNQIAPIESDVDFPQIQEKLSGVKYKVLVMSGKGGVGKSTVTTTLAHLSSSDLEKDVGVLDLDICGPSLPRMFNLEGETIHASGTGWSPVCINDKLCLMSIGFLLPSKDNAVIWRGAKKNGIIKQFLKNTEWGHQDLLLIDTPPGTSDEHLSIVSLLNAVADNSVTGGSRTGAILVTTPQEVSIQDVRKQINFCKKVGITVLGIIENMSGYVCGSCKRTTLVYQPTQGGVAKLCQDTGIPLLGKVPLDPVVMQAMDSGKNFVDYVDDENSSLLAYCDIMKNLESELVRLH